MVPSSKSSVTWPDRRRPTCWRSARRSRARSRRRLRLRPAPTASPVDGRAAASCALRATLRRSGHHIARSTMIGTPLVERTVVDTAVSASAVAGPVGNCSWSTQIVKRLLARHDVVLERRSRRSAAGTSTVTSAADAVRVGDQDEQVEERARWRLRPGTSSVAGAVTPALSCPAPNGSAAGVRGTSPARR